MKLLYQQLKRLILGIVLVSGCFACDRCDVYEMPVLRVHFPFQDVKIYTLRGPLIENMTVRSNEELQLPFSLISDTVVYEFESESGERKLLALTYERQNQFENNGCGFFLDMENVRELPHTSFPRVQISKRDYSTLWDIYIYE